MVAYGALLPQSLLDLVPHGFVNLHFSLLPAWRGAAPVQHAVLAGDEITGATTFRIVAELDAGPTYATVTEPIRPDRHLRRPAAPALGDRCRPAGPDPGRDRRRQPDRVEQPSEGVTIAPKITVEDARLDWSWPADRDRPGRPRLRAGPRGLDDLPRRPVQDQLGEPGARPGRRAGGADRDQADRVTVAAGDGTGFELGQVQAQGKKPMLAADWARGITFSPGEALGG